MVTGGGAPRKKRKEDAVWRWTTVLVVPLVLLLAACEEDDGGAAQYEQTVLRVQGDVAAAGLGLANAFLMFDACETDKECADAVLVMVDEWEAYLPVLDAALSDLESVSAPPKWEPFHESYTEQLRLRQQAGQ